MIEYSKFLDGPEDRMNVFILDDNMEKSVSYYANAHVVKILLEMGQLLSNGYRELFNDHLTAEIDSIIYKETHKNHPWSVWTRESIDNWLWLFAKFSCLSVEYSYRYGRIHKTFEKLYPVFMAVSRDIDKLTHINISPVPLCMPEQYRVKDNPVQSYRNYYLGEKSHLFDWKVRKTPYWIQAAITSKKRN